MADGFSPEIVALFESAKEFDDANTRAMAALRKVFKRGEFFWHSRNQVMRTEKILGVFGRCFANAKVRLLSEAGSEIDIPARTALQKLGATP